MAKTLSKVINESANENTYETTRTRTYSYIKNLFIAIDCSLSEIKDVLPKTNLPFIISDELEEILAKRINTCDFPSLTKIKKEFENPKGDISEYIEIITIFTRDNFNNIIFHESRAKIDTKINEIHRKIELLADYYTNMSNKMSGLAADIKRTILSLLSINIFDANSIQVLYENIYNENTAEGIHQEHSIDIPAALKIVYLYKQLKACSKLLDTYKFFNN